MSEQQAAPDLSDVPVPPLALRCTRCQTLTAWGWEDGQEGDIAVCDDCGKRHGDQNLEV